MKKNTIELTLSTLLVIFGVILITVSFFVPPTGVIDPSVLTAFGEILTFAGALIGIDAKYRPPQSPGPPQSPLKGEDEE